LQKFEQKFEKEFAYSFVLNMAPFTVKAFFEQVEEHRPQVAKPTPRTRAKSNNTAEASLSPEEVAKLAEVRKPKSKSKPPASTKPKPPASTKYYLYAETFLGPKRVLQVNGNFENGTWNGRDFFTKSIVKVQEAAQKLGYEFHFKSGTALASAKGLAIVKQPNLDFEEPDDWVQVESAIDHLRSGYSGVRIDLTLRYERIMDNAEIMDTSLIEEKALEISGSIKHKVFSLLLLSLIVA
jgi:hypothetical protein